MGQSWVRSLPAGRFPTTKQERLCNSASLNLFQGSFPRVQLFNKHQLGSGTVWLNVTFVAVCAVHTNTYTAILSHPTIYMTQLASTDICHQSVTASDWWNRVKTSNYVCVCHVWVSHSVWLRSFIVNRAKSKNSYTLTAVSHWLLMWRAALLCTIWNPLTSLVSREKSRTRAREW